jgi:5-keto 4-deoxyuronate isomerase
MLRQLPFLLVIASSSSLAWAVTTEVWKTQSADDFRAGKLVRAIVSSEGEVMLGRHADRVALSGVTLVWSALVAFDGNAYLGTAPKGAVLRLRGVRSGNPRQAEKVFETGQLAVTALAADDRGLVYAGTIPNGKIYRIDPVAGTAAEYVTLPARYVWALAVGDGGRLYAATGPEGKLFVVEAQGKASVLFDSKEQHLLALGRDRAGNLYAGSSPKAILFRVAPDGKATALNDFDGDEVRSLAVSGDDLFVAVNRLQGGPPVTPAFFGAQPPVPAQPSPGQPAPGPQPSAQPPQRPEPARPMVMPPAPQLRGSGAVYRLSGQGRVERILDLPSSHLNCVVADARGDAHACAGAEGRVYRVTANREVSVVFDCEEKQILSLAMLPSGRMVLGTGNGAAAYVVTEKQAAEGTFYSRIFDARFPSRWGNLNWLADGEVVVRTRSGNTENPDAVWSDWSPPLLRSPAKVASPPGRYLQYRVEFGRDPKAILREVEVYYLQQNQRARILALTVGEPPAGGGSSPSPPPSLGNPIRMGLTVIRASAPSQASKTPPPKDAPKARPQTAPLAPSAIPRHDPVRKISWRVENPDGDQLVYWVYVKEQSSPNWILLNQKEPLTETTYRWNTESVPDGRYLVRVKVSDERANPMDLALTHERVSTPVLVDNHKPRFADLKVDEKSLQVSGVVRDSFSVIRRIEYSVDGGDWFLIYPADGIYDDQEEKFRFTLHERPQSGSHTLTLRAYDSDGNIGTASLLFKAP